jgi:hypothetical protein
MAVPVAVPAAAAAVDEEMSTDQEAVVLLKAAMKPRRAVGLRRVVHPAGRD